MFCAKFGWNWPIGTGEKEFLKFVDVLSLFYDYLHLERAMALHLIKNLNPLHPRMLCAKFGWNWPSGSGVEVKNVKSLQTDNNRRMTCDQISSLEFSAQVN